MSEKPTVACAVAGCDVEFTPQRSTALYCSATCRQRARRARAAAVSEGKPRRSSEGDSPASGGVEHGLVKAVWAELVEADRLTTFKGQLALQLARRLVNPDESGVTALAKELQALMKDVTGPSAVAGDRRDEPEDDEVAKARQAREAKALAAAATLK